ncbi:hypothetical protein MARCHEWKA_05260 [Brevundimonas phage vB_BpoS-Marchewka]|uniref:Uncharacterized protein n=1 Tax=Brevundimonas phage vB_BpoS-Marchewka TaxID=2948604 RepID=A0A9E7N4Z6_9CAUD|nr:hypothetical protein MARCHEWKA_05260 [Brevundimonas phage vB_BpoS-Marchewka]UTC29475.1 hypothetical protein BAMBUS_03960 [Brevundimonas phage vB_BpoS-Bambus]
MRVITQIRIAFWCVVLAGALGGVYEITKAVGVVKPRPYWETTCAAYRTEPGQVRRLIQGQWIAVDHPRQICVRTERVCVVPDNAHPQTCKGAA